MMTSADSNSKYLSKEWQRDREKAFKRPDLFTATELADLDLTDLVRGRRYDDTFYKRDSDPIDPKTSPTLIDIRDRPEVGNNDQE